MGEIVNLANFAEDPDNVSEATDEEIARLAGKLKRVPLGLTAMRIAYVTDDARFPGRGMVISGNKRLRVLKQAYGETGEVPAEWFADVTAMSEAERHEFRLAANVSDGHWNVEKLLEQYERSELDDLIGDDAVAELLSDVEEAETDGETDEDAVPETPEEPKSEQGKIYQLGRHRVMCGDSTKDEDVARLMDGELADLVVTDPPYNVALGTGGSVDDARKRHRRTDGLCIMNDKMEDGDFYKFLLSYFKAALNIMSGGASIYVWHADNEGLNFRLAFRDAGFHLRQTLIWVKNSMTLGRQDYQWRHEPCLYGWKDGTHNWYSDRKQTTCLEFNRPSVSKDHPTMKPVELFEYQIKNSSKQGDVVYDGFGGSGTTAIACEKIVRVARLMELDQRYCDVIRRRWAEFVHGEGCDWESITPEVSNNENNNEKKD